MATKTFKIGLSNTDKQNMAQDVYERLLALTFPEYDTATQYEVGDFVVYNDQLYKCIGSTSGAWDSTKWQLATLNDLVTDIENAVAFVNDKANVDGNYPTMTVGMADNLTPYDESAGDDQDEPFSLQATGTGNGTQPDFATGSAALMKEKQGNTVVVNQKAKELNVINYVGSGASASFSNGIATFTATQQYGKLSSQTDAFNMINGHKYLAVVEHKGTIGSFNVYFSSGQYIGNLITDSASAFTLVAKVFEYSQASGNTTLHFQDNRTSDWTEQQIKNLIIVDLTQWFNGDIPADLLAHPSNFFRYYQGSLAYNVGTLVNANGRYIKCIGMNQWDEEWELGNLDTTTGETASSNNTIRSKNFIKCIPNTTYYFLRNAHEIRTFWYDKDHNLISYTSYLSSNNSLTSPSNAIYFKIVIVGTTYNNDISINLYYEDEPRCLTYEPYQVLTNNDTGTEVLRSAGSVKDSKAPDGTITRRIGVVDLGTLDWHRVTCGANILFEAKIEDMTRASGTDKNLICPKYPSITGNFVYANATDKVVFNNPGGSNNLKIVDTDYNDAATFKTAMSGVYLFYELDEPTTEQGTPYSENLVIDDFGSMDFDSDVPQGALIFYPVDYKAFVDTLYKYTDGTPSDIALKSDLSADKTELQGVDTQLLNAVGGTLRQLLANANSINFNDTAVVDMSTLSWQKHTSEGHEKFYTNSLVGLIKPVASANDKGNIFSTKYETATANQVYSHSKDLIISVETNSQLSIYDASALNTHTSGSTFDPTLKGQLLAYEKASE